LLRRAHSRIGRFSGSRDGSFPYLEVDFRIHGAASGGPILSGPHVVGINCTEYRNLDHPPGPGFGVQSRCLADAFLDNIVLLDETAPRRVTFDELVRAGVINVDGYAPRNPAAPSRGSLVHIDIAPTAKTPAIEYEMYA
jgi:hypothetical protein